MVTTFLFARYGNIVYQEFLWSQGMQTNGEYFQNVVNILYTLRRFYFEI
jgi:hypothetical protein